MSNFLSKLHADLRLTRLTKRGATHSAEDVPQGLHKEYPRMHQVVLPRPEPISATLQYALEKRRSANAGDPSIPLSTRELGTVLGLSLSKREQMQSRNYPSGGALYPIETYLISMSLESQTPAVFHYNPTKHVLERLWDLPADFDIKNVARSPDSLPLSTLLVFTSVWRRSSAKYGDLAYLHALIEAGHMSENILLTSTALGISARPYAGFDDALIEKLLDLDESEEQPVHTITLCKNSPLPD